MPSNLSKFFVIFPLIKCWGSSLKPGDPLQPIINKRGIELLDKFAKVYTPYSGKTTLNIIGYSDATPVTSKYRRYKDNLELSVLRAVAAQRVLQQAGIPIKQTRLMGFGVKEKLLDEETAETERKKLALSRKIMLVVEPIEGGQ